MLMSGDRNNQGVWIREIFPDFSIYGDDSPRFDVKGIFWKDLYKKDLFSIVIQRQKEEEQKNNYPRGVDLSFAKKAINCFYNEYRCLRENGMIPFVRGALKKGVRFEFYQNDSLTHEESQSIAEYNVIKKQLK